MFLSLCPLTFPCGAAVISPFRAAAATRYQEDEQNKRDTKVLQRIPLQKGLEGNGTAVFLLQPGTFGFLPHLNPMYNHYTYLFQTNEENCPIRKKGKITLMPFKILY